MSTSTTNLHDLTRSGTADVSVKVAQPASRWKTRVLLPAVIVLVIIALLASTSLHMLLPATPVRVVPIVVKTVEGASGSVTVQAPGWLEPDPYPMYVSALADGIVAQMLALEGDRVDAGQVVAKLIDDDARLALQRAEAELAQRNADALAAEARVIATRQEVEQLVNQTLAVGVGEAAVAEARAELLKVEADIAVEQARLAELQDEYDRKSQLVDSQAVSEAVVARLRLRVDAQKATVDATAARRSILEAQFMRLQVQLQAAVRNRELLIVERRDVALAEAEHKNAEAAVQLAAAARDEAALRLDRMSVRSPASGIVMRRLTSPGSKVVLGATSEHSAHVVHIYDPKKLQVRVDVPLADAAHVSVGQSAEITVEVLPDRTFTGIISRIVHEADIQKNTVEVKVAIDAPSVELKPEMLARVRFLAMQSTATDGVVRQRIFAPQSLIRNDEGGATVMAVSSVKEQRGRAERRAVVTGSRVLDGWVEIESGLNVGDLLIADPPADLKAGDRVRVIGEQSLAGERSS